MVIGVIEGVIVGFIVRFLVVVIEILFFVCGKSYLMLFDVVRCIIYDVFSVLFVVVIIDDYFFGVVMIVWFRMLSDFDGLFFDFVFEWF